MVNLIQILEKCIEMDQNPRMLKWTNAYHEDGSDHYYRIISTLKGVVPKEIFSSCQNQGIFVTSVVDTGVDFGFIDGERCVLICCMRTVSQRLYIGRYYGELIKKDAFVRGIRSSELEEYCDAISSDQLAISSNVCDIYEIQSPYGFSIDVPDLVVEPEFNEPNDSAPDAASKFKSGGQIKKRASRRGEVWWVKHLECSKEEVSSPYHKNRPIVVIQVVRGKVLYYRCTTND